MRPWRPGASEHIAEGREWQEQAKVSGEQVPYPGAEESEVRRTAHALSPPERVDDATWAGVQEPILCHISNVRLVPRSFLLLECS